MSDIFFHNLKAIEVRKVLQDESILPLNCAQNRLSGRQDAIWSVVSKGSRGDALGPVTYQT